MNELILSVFMTFISGQQVVPLNSECSVVVEKERNSGNNVLSNNGTTVAVLDEKTKVFRMYHCGTKHKKISVMALNLTKDDAYSIYENLYKTIVHIHGKPERDSKTFKNTSLGLIAEFKTDLKFTPYAQWDILPKNNGRLNVGESGNNKWSIGFSIEGNKQVNCGTSFEFKACQIN